MNLDWSKCLPDASSPPTLDCVVPVFQAVVQAALMLVGATIVILIIMSGYKFITSGGDAKQVEGARKAFTYAIIGLLVVLFSFFLINFIGDVTGITCIRNFGFTACQ